MPLTYHLSLITHHSPPGQTPAKTRPQWSVPGVAYRPETDQTVSYFGRVVSGNGFTAMTTRTDQEHFGRYVPPTPAHPQIINSQVKEDAYGRY